MPEPFDPARVQFAVKGVIALPMVLPEPSDAVRYLQSALNRLGVPDDRGAPLLVDGQPGPRTAAAVATFQEHQGLARTMLVDQDTWHHLDWCVYDGWTPAPATLTRLGANGPAIKNGTNRYGGWPVNSRGLCREAQRLADVTNWLAPIDFRQNYAVDRNARGSTKLSRHALGVANDDMTDLDRDRLLEPDEIAQCNMIAAALVARCDGWPTKVGALAGGERVSYAGPDRLATVVWGNHRDADGRWYFSPVIGSFGRNDWAWNPVRRKWRPLTSKVHGNHLHADVVPGAPVWRPL